MASRLVDHVSGGVDHAWVWQYDATPSAHHARPGPDAVGGSWRADIDDESAIATAVIAAVGVAGLWQPIPEPGPATVDR